MSHASVIGSLAEYAKEMRDAPDDDDRYRLALSFVTDFETVDDPCARMRAIEDEPPPIGDRRWDAMVAGLAEHYAFHYDLLVPLWALDERRFLEAFWFPVDLPSVRVTALVSSPASLARRGIFIDRRDLDRV